MADERDAQFAYDLARMSDDVIAEVSRKWEGLGLPGSGRPIWK